MLKEYPGALVSIFLRKIEKIEGKRNLTMTSISEINHNFKKGKV
jgi:hypothetical protein